MEDPTIGWDDLQFVLNSLHLAGSSWELSTAPTHELSNLLHLSRDQKCSVFFAAASSSQSRVLPEDAHRSIYIEPPEQHT